VTDVSRYVAKPSSGDYGVMRYECEKTGVAGAKPERDKRCTGKREGIQTSVDRGVETGEQKEAER